MSLKGIRMSNKKHNYVIATFWRDDETHHLNETDDQLAVYCYGSDVHYGTLEEAKSFAKYITEKVDDGRVFKPFIINTTPIED